MRKELFIAIAAGVLVGVLVAFGIWRANSALKVKIDEAISPTVSQKPESPSPEPQALKVTLTEPESWDVITSTPSEVAGITKANSWIVISGESEDIVFEADASGAFDENIDLTAGINQILIRVFSPPAHQSNLDIGVVYSTEFAKEVEASQREAGKTSNDQESRQKALEKVESVKKDPKAYIGTVTDKTQETLQIKNPQGEIQLISIDPAASFIKTGSKTTEIASSDLAIGDFIVAMGFRNGNTVLSAKRILVTPAIEAPDRNIIYGIITKIEKKSVIIKNVRGDNFTFQFPKVWKGPEINELSAGDSVIAIGIPDQNALMIRTITLVGKQP